MHLLPFVKKTFLPCLCMLMFFTASCEQVFFADKFAAPSTGSLAFDGEHFWLATSSSIIFKINSFGEFIDYIDISIGYIRGITFDGENLWAAVWSDPALLYKIDTAGNILDSFEIPFLCIPDDLAFDGTNILLSNSLNGKIYRLGPEGTMIDSFRFPDNAIPSAIECDGNHLWLLSSVKRGRYYYTTISKAALDGTVIETFICPIEDTRMSSLALGNNQIWCSGIAFQGEVRGINFIFKTDIDPYNEKEI